MLRELHEGKLDLARLNYGVLTLIPKIKGATNIKQFRLVCLLNCIYKIITKALTLRIDKIAARVISRAQSASIPGRYILDGMVVIHEVLHELRSTKK